MYVEQTIADRVRRVDHVALLYGPNSGLCPPEIATDLLADLMHWCAAQKVDFADVLATAAMHHRAEQAEETAQ